MLPILLASVLSCYEAQGLVENINKARVPEKPELIEVVKANTEEGCWDAKAD